MKFVWGMEVFLHLFLNLALDESVDHNVHEYYVNSYHCGKFKSRKGRLLIRMSKIFETPLVAQLVNVKLVGINFLPEIILIDLYWKQVNV
jgi:hypothetical protein